MTYSPEGFDPLTFFDVMPRFRDGSDTPRAYFERCLVRHSVIPSFPMI